eukprot:scaffold11974_cov91-Cyclotella_meneghiniana.AAC.2
MSHNFDPVFLPHPGQGFFYQQHYEPFVSLYLGININDNLKEDFVANELARQNYKTRRLIGILRGVSSDDFSFEEATLKGIVQHCEIHTFDLAIAKRKQNN